jgi:hypothetical protein
MREAVTAVHSILSANEYETAVAQSQELSLNTLLATSFSTT